MVEAVKAGVVVWLILPVVLMSLNYSDVLQITPFGYISDIDFDRSPFGQSLERAFLSCSWMFLWLTPVIYGVIIGKNKSEEQESIDN